MDTTSSRPRLLLIVNLKSGVNSKQELMPTFVERLEGYGYQVETAVTRYAGHATQLAADAVRRGVHTVVVCGGDGTVNETAQSLIGTDTVMGIIPSGSGNGLARHLNIPVDELRSLDVIGQGHVVECDSGMAGDHPFLCTFGLGFDASVSRRFALEPRRGRISYIKSVVEEFAKYKPLTYSITIDGADTIEREAFLIACCNTSQYGNNAFIAPGASTADGLLDVVIIKSGSALNMMVAGFDILTGMVPYNSNIETLRAKEVRICHQGRAYAHVDGEPISIRNEVTVTCQPHKLKVLAPEPPKRITPFITPFDYTLRDWGIAIEKLFR